MTPKNVAIHKIDPGSLEKAQQALEAAAFTVQCVNSREDFHSEMLNAVDFVLIPGNLLEELGFSPSGSQPGTEKEREYQREIENLKDEVIFYANSTSWKITRPLRKLVQRLKR